MQNYITKAEFKTQLFNLLGDKSKRFWTDIEINSIIEESFYSWGGISTYWKENGELIVNNSKSFWNLNETLKNPNNELLIKPTLTYGDILNRVCYDLMEMREDELEFKEFSEQQILQVIDRKVNSFKQLIGLIVEEEEFIPKTNLIDLGDRAFDIIRVSFKDSLSNKWTILKKEDEINLSSFDKNFDSILRPPKYYSTFSNETNILKIFPQLLSNGTLHLLLTRGRDNQEELLKETLLGIPDNLVFYIKYGVEEDLLYDDSYRRNYCRDRWQEGIIVGNSFYSVINSQINGRSCSFQSLSDLDDYEPKWQNTIGKPKKIAMAGINIISLDKIPEANKEYSILLNVARNAIIPRNEDSSIQIESEYLEAILHYCFHLAMFKCGFSEIQSSINSLKNFRNSALLHNSRLSKMGTTFETIIRKSKSQEIEKPRFQKEILVEENAAT